jgi:glucose dehydrogenase
MRRRIGRSISFFLGVLAFCVLGISLSAQTTPDVNWPYYGGDAGGMRYSRLTQFKPENVSGLKIAWVFLQGASDIPCTAPPWGMLSAVDLNEGTIKWQVPLGSMQHFGGGHDPVPQGSIGFGGLIITAAGLGFIAGTFDPYIRAFDVQTGKELWKAQLPASGNATPMTYSVNGKQYLVIAAGGHPKITEESLNDALVAFTLP